MASKLSLDPARTALLSMDMQVSIVSRYIKDSELITRAQLVMQHARELGMRVIHVQVGFRRGLPEISSRNPLFNSIRTNEDHRKMFEGPQGAIHSAVSPEGSEVVITKHRISAFSGTDLEMILRANEIDTLLMMGIATSGVVLSSWLEAFDKDFRLVALQDCCADLDANLHAALIEKMFPRLGSVISAADFLGAASAV
jgi:nicotinamidase-related amidase